MDSKSKHESRDQRHEEALARRLGEALGQISPHGAGSCPDAEQIAAYYERELSPDESVRCEVHFATCPQCRKTLGLLAATAETPLAQKDVVRLTEATAETAPKSNAEPRPTVVRPKRFDWRVRWLLPALGVAAAMAAWFAVRPPWRAVEQIPSGNLVVRNIEKESLPPPEIAPTIRAPKAGPARQQADSLSSLKTRKVEPPANARSGGSESSATNELSSNKDADALVSNSVSSEVAPEKEPEKEKDSTDLKKATTNVASAAPPAFSPPIPSASSRAQAMQAPSMKAPEAPPTPQTPASRSQNATVTGEAPVVNATGGTTPAPSIRDKQGASDQRNAPAIPLNSRNFAKLDLVAAPSVQAKAPSGNVVWRIGRGGRIERSLDRGKAWITQASPSNEDWLTGAAVSDSVCWVAGRNGAIARTTDGEHWEHVAPPSADTSGKLPDLVNITATSAQVATLTAADGRHFVTQDGGKTWQAR